MSHAKIQTDSPLRVFYDGACSLCNAEMKVLRRWDHAQRLLLIDIAAPDFDARAWPVSVAQMNDVLHVRLSDGTWLTAMAATREIYRAVGRGWMLTFTGWPVFEGLFDRAYAWFARHRMPISAHFGKPRCTDATCRIAH